MTDYNFGTLIRRDAARLYGEDNTVLVTRVQFFAIEVSEEGSRGRSIPNWVLEIASSPSLILNFAVSQIARNRAGLNDAVYEKAQAGKAGS